MITLNLPYTKGRQEKEKTGKDVRKKSKEEKEKKMLHDHLNPDVPRMKRGERE